MKTNYILFFTLSCFMTLSHASFTHAQESYPEFSFSTLNDDSKDSLSSNKLQANIVIKKPLMRDILVIQDQINLLKGLIERQASIKQIADNYKNVGLPFVQPAPPQSICEKLPVNLLCLNFYPDMPMNASIIDNFEPVAPALDLQNQVDALNNIDLGASDTSMAQTATTAPEKPIRNYNWADIQCLGIRCTALVTSDNNFRLRVSEGDLLPDDSRVSAISFSKVTIKDGDVSSDLQPLSVTRTLTESSAQETGPTQQMAQAQDTSRPQSASIRQLIDSNLEEPRENPYPSESNNHFEEEDTFAGEDSSTGGTLMSPTGLF